MSQPNRSIYLIVTCIIIQFSFITCLHEDQRGKFDWHKRFIGIPKFVQISSKEDNLIIGTENNVIASIQSSTGNILWRQLMPPGCNLDHMSARQAEQYDNDFIIRTSCSNDKGEKSILYWISKNGLSVSEEEFNEISDGSSGESISADQGHILGDNKVFTIDQDKSLTVSNDGAVSFRDDHTVLWTREESLASIVSVDIVQLPLGMRDKFGLRKRIVALTEIGKIFCLDTFTSNIEWQLFDKELAGKKGQGSNSMLFLLKQSDDESSEYAAVAIQPDGFSLTFNPITGQIIDKKRLPNGIVQIAQTEIFDPTLGRALLIVDKSFEVHIVPNSLTEQVKQNIDGYYLTIVDRTSPILEGYKFVLQSDRILPKKIWKFQAGESEEIVNLKMKRVDEEVHSPARVLGDRGILYKYLNPNLIAVMTQSNTGSGCTIDHSINIYLIDGVTGSLVHSVHHPKSRNPTNMVHSEDWLVYSYYHTKNRRIEISSLELFEGTSQSNSTAFSSLARGSSIKPNWVEHKSFIFPGGINAMIDTVTLRGMTNKHLIVALPSGGLLEIPKIFLDPRRPINMLMEHREEGLIPYMPELPIPSESIINYDQTLMMVRGITTSPAHLESTSLVFAYGLDLFFTRVTPSKTFDILKDDFDHLLITGVLIFLIVASYISKLLAQRKALHAAWK